MKLIDTDNDNNNQPTIRFMLELGYMDGLVIGKALHLQGMRLGDPFNDREAQLLRQTSQAIIARYKEQDILYTGKEYEIWARGKRRLRLGFKREPDMYLGSDTGRNFLEACIHFFTCIQYTAGAYNIKKNTISGHELFCPSDDA